MNRLVLVIFSFILLQGNVFGKGCFTKHIADAIKLNKERRDLYRHTSIEKGLPSSEFLSNGLINFERLIYPFAFYYDRSARQFQNKGISILCSDLVDMEETPEYKPLTTQIPRAKSFKTYPLKKWKKELRNLSSKRQWNSYKEKIEEYLDLLKMEKGSHCLVKHFLESVGRTASLANGYLAKLEKSKDQKKLNRFLKRFVNLQMLGLLQANRLDQRAFPYQKVGIPIFCQDVPPIHIE